MLNPRWGQQRLSGRALALLGLFAFFLFLPGRASTPPFDRDEPRYMEATAQMLESGNFVDVRFQDKPRYLQPAGIYWMEAASVAATGTLKSRAVWAYRLPSLLAMTASVVLTAWMGSVLFGSTAGLGAGLLLMVSVLVTAENRMGTIDTTLLLSVLLAQAGLLRALCDREAERPTPLRTALLYWGAIGCGLMLKGPVILIPSLATPFCLAVVERNFSLWRRLRPLWGWLISLAILLPWCIAIGVVSHGEFFRRAVGTNFLGKVASGQQAHGLPPGYHLLVFLIAFWPGSFFAAAALPAVWKNRTLLPVKYLLCWILPHWLVFELIATKLPHYVLPTYPAIAILTAGMLTQGAPVWAGWPRTLWARLVLWAYGVLWTVAGVALALAGPILLWKLEHVVSPAALILAAGSLPLVGLSVIFICRSELRKALLTSAACAMLLYTGLFLVVVPRLHSIWMAPRLTALVNAHRPCAQTEVSSVSFSEPSLVFLMGGKVHLEGPEEAAHRMLSNEACTVALVDVKNTEAFLATLGPARDRLRTYGSVTGVNYSNGHHLTISLYQIAR